MVISGAHVAEMVAHARAEYPNECCGLLASKEGRVVRCIPTTNADASPVHYTIAPQEQLKVMMQIDDDGHELAGIYHSHTHTAAYPSKTDVELAFYPDSVYVIVSLADSENPDIQAYRIIDGAVVRDTIEIE